MKLIRNIGRTTRQLGTVVAIGVAASLAGGVAQAGAIPNPVITKGQAATATQAYAIAYCTFRISSPTHKCSYPPLAVTKLSCAGGHVTHTVTWLYVCDMRFGVYEKGAEIENVYGCKYVLHKNFPNFQLQGFCREGRPVFIRSNRRRR